MDYKKLHEDTITKLQEMVNSGKITVEVARGICADFEPESGDERVRKELIYTIRLAYDCGIKISIENRDKYLAWIEKQGERKSLDNIAKEVIKDKDAAISFLKSTGIINENGELADEYKIDQGEQTSKHFELKSGHWYICHRAFCCRADHLTVKEGERFMCEKDGIVKGFEIKEPEKYFKEVCPPAPMEDELKPADKIEQKSNIQLNPEEYINDMGGNGCYLKNVTQNSAWSEEDEKMLNEIIICGEHHCYLDAENIAWLKSLRPH